MTRRDIPNAVRTTPKLWELVENPPEPPEALKRLVREAEQRARAGDVGRVVERLRARVRELRMLADRTKDSDFAGRAFELEDVADELEAGRGG